MYPRAKLIIRDDTDPEVEYKNVSLLNKSSYAVAEALKRYQVPIERVAFINNGIKSQETMLLMSCLERHFDNIKILQITKNRIGIQGFKCIADVLGSLKQLVHLDLSYDEVGDTGLFELITAIDL